jgi:L-2-hydroxyglutarate oxidase
VINKEFDYIVIGAGIVGISLGLAILERSPEKKVLIIDKESKDFISRFLRKNNLV